MHGNNQATAIWRTTRRRRSRAASELTAAGGRGLESPDGVIELHGGERGVISDPAGPGKTVYVVLSLEATPAGAR